MARQDRSSAEGTPPQKPTSAVIETGGQQSDDPLRSCRWPSGLRPDAFSGLPDSSFHYTNAELRTLYNALLESVSARSGLFLVTGDTGTGKTALLMRLADEMRAAGFTVTGSIPPDQESRRPSSVASGPDGISDSALSGSTVPADAHEAPEAAAAREPAANGRVVLFIDGADDLDNYTLGRLAALLRPSGEEGAAPIRIVLSGRVPFVTRLFHPVCAALRSALVLHTRLHRLDDADIAGLIWHRLRRAGHRGPGLFSEDAVAAIARLAQGLPGRAMLLAAAAAERTAATGGLIVSAEFVRQAVDLAAAPAAEYRPAAAAAASPATPHLPSPRLFPPSAAQPRRPHHTRTVLCSLAASATAVALLIYAAPDERSAAIRHAIVSSATERLSSLTDHRGQNGAGGSAGSRSSPGIPGAPVLLAEWRRSPEPPASAAPQPPDDSAGQSGVSPGDRTAAGTGDDPEVSNTIPAPPAPLTEAPTPSEPEPGHPDATAAGMGSADASGALPPPMPDSALENAIPPAGGVQADQAAAPAAQQQQQQQQQPAVEEALPAPAAVAVDPPRPADTGEESPAVSEGTAQAPPEPAAAPAADDAAAAATVPAGNDAAAPAPAEDRQDAPASPPEEGTAATATATDAVQPTAQPSTAAPAPLPEPEPVTGTTSGGAAENSDAGGTKAVAAVPPAMPPAVAPPPMQPSPAVAREPAPAKSAGGVVKNELLTKETIGMLMRRGDEMLMNGDISAARLLYERAAAAGDARAATAAGKMYDPVFLTQIGAVGVEAYPEKAARWYRQAMASGDAEAGARMARLQVLTGK